MALGACTSLSSCWFNSAGYIFDKASYKAQSKTSDLKVGSSVYYKDGSYYIDLPRYKTGKGPQIMYGVGAKDKKKERHELSGTQVFRVPDYYANYLLGRTKTKCDTSSLILTPVSDSYKTNCDSTFTVVNNPGDATTNYSYSSSSAAWLYTAGVFDVLCVDIPVSATCTALAITGVTLAVLAEDGSNKGNGNGGYVRSYGGNSSDFNQYLRKANAGDAYSQAMVALCYYTGDGTYRDTTRAWYYVNRSVNQGSHWGYGAAAAMFQDDGDLYTARNGFIKAENAARRVGNHKMADFYRSKWLSL